MRTFLCLMVFLSTSSFAGFEKLSAQNLNFEYGAPYGKGTIEKVGLGYSLKNGAAPYEVSIEKTHNSFEMTSDFLDFSWMNPYKFFYNMEKFDTQRTSFGLGGSSHFIESEQMLFVPEGRGKYLAQKLLAKCEGSSSGEFKIRVMEDCKTKLDVSIKRVEVPADFILYKILYELPQIPGEFDIPGDNFILSSRDGKFNMQLYIKYYVYAGLRAHGHFQYEDNHQTLAIKVNQIKFGFFNVTGFVMGRLQEVIKNPDIKIDPPWIRINIGKPNEDR